MGGLDLMPSTSGRQQSAGLPGKCAGVSNEQIVQSIISTCLTDSPGIAIVYQQEQNLIFCCD